VENTTQFLAALEKLSGKVSDLQTKVTTEALRTELAKVKTELQKTQEALIVSFAFNACSSSSFFRRNVPLRDRREIWHPYCPQKAPRECFFR
jgi:GH24 family phage-related lysozyme (muramidase)